MHRDSDRKKTLVIGPREFTIFVLVLAALGMAVVVAAFAVTSRRAGGEPASEITPATVAGAGEPEVQAEGLPGVAPEPTSVLAPTIEPTPEQISHVVQSGETLEGIAALYGVSLQTILDANGLTADSVIWVGQTLIVPLLPEQQGAWHVVQPGETLIQIAQQYGVTPEAIQSANNLPDPNAIYSGQRLRIPGVAGGEAPASAPAAGEESAPVPTLDPLEGLEDGPLMSDWPRSILEGDLDTNYPLIYQHPRFTLHYQPGTYPDQHLSETVDLIASSLARVEATLGVQLNGKFDIYVAGTLFEAPNAHLRGLSRSPDRKLFLLHDGSGDEVENAYLVTHELTHLVSWNTWGAPSSTMLSEGLATYVGAPVLDEGGYLPVDQVCLGAYAAGRMRSMAAIERDWQSFEGHIRDRFNYFGSACFVRYLVETYGLGPLSQLYNTSEYLTLYGTSLDTLDADWQASLAARQSELTIDPQEMVTYTDEVAAVYDYVFDNYNGTGTMHRAYALVDQARLALWRGDYPSVRRLLDELYALTGFTPG